MSTENPGRPDHPRDNTSQTVRFTFSFDLDRPVVETAKGMSEEITNTLRGIAGVSHVRQVKWRRR